MDPIELMAIKPWQINRALGTDRVKVVRANPKIYRARQLRIRRGLEPESEPEDQTLEIRPLSRCTDMACCGGAVRRKHRYHQQKPSSESQTDPIDLTHYWDTDEMLKLLNLTILTGRPRDIQDGVIRRTASRQSIEIQQTGSSATIGSQVDLRRPNDESSKIAHFFRKPLQFFQRFVKAALFPPVRDIPSPSSSESEILENGPEERDHEWMTDTSSEKSQNDVQAAYELDQLENPPKQSRIELQCYELMTVMKPLWWILKCGGRWPFQTYVEDRLFKFRLNKWTPGFFAFILTTIFLISCSMLGTINIFRLVLSSNQTGSYQQQVEKVLFNKYWPYAFATLVYGLYAIIWSLSTIFDDGHFLAQFMSRWNLGVSAIRYNPCELGHYEMWLSLGWLIFYFSSMLGFFIWDLVPAVRGTSSLLGFLILRSFVPDEAMKTHFATVRVFGLFFHLYTVYCARVITLWIIMYCKFLENLARLWNLRFCYVFGMLGRRESPNTYITYHTVIPYTKLFSEHKLITDFSRYTGRIFAVTLIFYFVLKGLEMITLGYFLCNIILVKQEDLEIESLTNQTSLPCEGKDCEEVPYKDEPAFQVLTIMYFTLQSYFGWYITTEGISDCGQAIMSGWTFVRRMGYPRCKNAKERRFIQSMYFTFSPTLDYYLNIGFDIKINRKFIYNMFAFVFVGVTSFVMFNPFRLEPQLVTFCTTSENNTLICTTSTVPRFAISLLIEDLQNKYPGGSAYKQDPVPTTLTPPVLNLTKLGVVLEPEPGPAPGSAPGSAPGPAILPEPVLPEPVLPEPVLPEPVLPEPVLPEPVLPEPVLPEPVLPEPVLPEPPTTTTTTTTATTPKPTTTTTTPKPLPPDYHVCDCTDVPFGVFKCLIPVFCDKNGKVVEPFSKSPPVLSKFARVSTCSYDSTKHDDQPYLGSDILYKDGDLRVCSTGQEFKLSRGFGDRDDCFNFPFKPTTPTTTKTNNIAVTMILGTDKYTCCCYQYDWHTNIKSPRKTGNNCHMLNTDHANTFCSKTKCQKQGLTTIPKKCKQL